MKKPNAKSPETHTELKIGKPATKAVGVKAIAESLRQMNKYMDKVDALRVSTQLNQKGGIDCPGCAWPDPEDERSSIGEYCENGIKAIAEEATNKSIGERFFRRNSVQDISEWSDFKIGKQGRLTEPMFLPEGADYYEPISWDNAFQLIANQLNTLGSPDEAIFYTSGRTSNEAAFLYQLFVREYGTNNLPDCSNMCHEPSSFGLSKTVGIGKASVTLPDLYEAEVIIVMGQNPGTNHPRMLSALERCKENGGQIITINPILEAGLTTFVNPQRPMKILSGGTPLTDLFLQVRVNGDVALLKAIMLVLLEEEKANPGTVFDKKFIREKTIGYEELIEDLQRYSFDEIAAESGVSPTKIREAAAMIQHKTKIIICWAMGITQHENGVDNVREIVNLLLLKGSIGKRGAGTCPVRGHSNVQGDRTMGIWESPPKSLLDSIEKVFGFKPPQEHGYSVVEAIRAMHEGKAKVFFAMGGNFFSATPDTEMTAQALRQCELTVHVSTKLNRSHLVHGKQALILPCLARTNKDEQAEGEQFVSVENSMGVVHSSQGVLKAISDKLLSEPAIVCRLAQATLPQSKVEWKKMAANYDHIRSAIERVIPGFDNYNERVREPGGFYLPNGARTGTFNTESGKAHFTINKTTHHNLQQGEYLMMTNRSHDQYNTTIYGLDDRYRGIYNERRIVLMHPQDMKTEGLKVEDVVDLTSHFKGKTREAKRFIVVPYDVPQGCVMTYFPEANVLIPLEKQAHTSKTPASKSVKVRVQKC